MSEFEPAAEHPGCLGRAEVVDQVVQPQHPAGPHHPRDAIQRHRFPEVGQLVKRVAGAHAVRRRSGMLVAEEARPDTGQVRQPGGRRPLAEHCQHGRRDVDRRHVPEPRGRGERELADPGAEVQDIRGPVQAVRLEDGQVLLRVGITLLPVVTRHEGRVEVFWSRVCQFVDHPALGHEPILPGSATGPAPSQDPAADDRSVRPEPQSG
jgi:hypothetical protein